MSVRRGTLLFRIKQRHCPEDVVFCAEHLLIYRISSHTSPIIRKHRLNKSVQGSTKQEAAPCKTVLVSAGKHPKNIQICVWEQDAAGSNPVTRTTL